MNLIQTRELSENQLYDAKTLIDLCRLTDHTKGISFLENGVNAISDFPAFYLMYNGNMLISFLSVFLPNEEECEIYANTLPEYRKKGYFRQLFELASEQLKKYGIYEVKFVNEPGCEAGREALGRIGAEPESSEYLMSYCMQQDANPLGNLRLEAEEVPNGRWIRTFRENEPVGSVQVEIEQNVAAIYNVEVFPEYRGRGYGRETLLQTIQYLKQTGCCKILLHVSSSNPIAYHLYSHHGFVHVEQLDYWKKSLQ